MIHRFTGSDGDAPYGDLIFDEAGNIYGTTSLGGGSCLPDYECGTLYKLTPSGNGWTESILHTFDDGNGPLSPRSGVVFDSTGNLYGTTVWGGTYGYGTVYQLKPQGSEWTASMLYSFNSGAYRGYYPQAGLIFDETGTLYGSTMWGGANGGGNVFELTSSNGRWIFTLIYDGSAWFAGPWAALTMDAAGNLYGTAVGYGPYPGSVFKLTRSGAGWGYASLYNFTGGEGASPRSQVLNKNGVLYGTALANRDSYSGYYGYGVVWEITP